MGLENDITAKSMPTPRSVFGRLESGQKMRLMTAFDTARVHRKLTVRGRVGKVLDDLGIVDEMERGVVLNAFERFSVLADEADNQFGEGLFVQMAISGAIQGCINRGEVPLEVQKFLALVQERL